MSNKTAPEPRTPREEKRENNTDANGFDMNYDLDVLS
jgi:hypothetical protein